jgi:Calx-beta domain
VLLPTPKLEEAFFIFKKYKASKMKYFIFNLFFILVSFHISAQNYDIRFQISSINCETKQVCYDIQLRPNGAGSFNLAGQNYRIYYNSSRAAYLSGQSLLPSQYGEFTLVQDEQGVNATEMNGPLAFESTLGFLNFAMDLNDTQNGGINLPANQWTSTSNLCFSVEDVALNDASSCLQFIWGREGLTDMYATAFVEVSRWVSTNNTTNARGILYNDLGADDAENSCIAFKCQSTSISVADLTVNESIGIAQIQVCLSSPTSEIVTVNLTTSDSTAVAPDDYAPVTNAMVTIPVGQTCSSVFIPITNDTISEINEVFKVMLTNPSLNVTVRDSFGLVTIVDDEAIPTVSIQDVTVDEEAGTALLKVCLSGVSSQITTMVMNTSNGSAVAGSDYTAESNRTVSIPSGLKCVTIHLNLLDDLFIENTESFKVLFSNISANAILVDSEALVTIINNDNQCQAKAPVISGN